MESEIKKCVELLSQGKVIIYPTDTIWGIGADATNKDAIDRIFNIKERPDSKSMIILIDSSDRLPLYVKKIPIIAWDLISHTHRPTTFVYSTAYNLPSNIISSNGTIAIRIVENTFCKKLIKALDKPIVSTSANFTLKPAPNTFSEIEPNLLRKVDHIVPERYSVSTDYKASRIIKFIDDYNFSVIRE